MADKMSLQKSVCLLFLCMIVNCSCNIRSPELETGLYRMKRSAVNVDAKVRERRSGQSAGDYQCGIQESDIKDTISKVSSSDPFIHTYKFVNQTNYNFHLVWAGEGDGKLVASATEEFIPGLIPAKESHLYTSKDDGKSWVDANQKINGQTIRAENGLQKHPHYPSQVYVVTYLDSGGVLGGSKLYRSLDGGDSFNGRDLPFTLDSVIQFHPYKNNADAMMTISRSTKQLWLSTDSGMNWEKILDDVQVARWGQTNADGTVIFAMVDQDGFDIWSFLTGDSFHFNLKRLSNFKKDTKNWVTLKEDIFSFGLQDKFLYVSLKKDAESESDERLMHVSTNDGKTWNEVQLPTITPDRFYSIMDATEGRIIMHVDDPEDTGTGTLYISDATGILYSVSLMNHLYPNYVQATDFYTVKSMRGVYLASQLMEDQAVRTTISYDMGAEWKFINRPNDDSECKDETKECYLELHNQFSRSQGIASDPPLSRQSAIGVLLAHGHVARALQTTPPDVFVSSDGGYTWTKALEGPHHYEIADQGGLLVAIPAEETPKTIRFSVDQGRCWHSLNFTTKDVVFTRLLTEPGNKAMSVSIWGYDKNDHQWQVFVIDFSKIITKNCDPDTDFEAFTPHGGICLNGQKETFYRVKQDSLCRSDSMTKRQDLKQNCTCTKADYDCDYGYQRQVGSDNCVEDQFFKGTELHVCLRGHEEKIITKGYHKIPGNKCQGDIFPNEEKIDLNVLCSEFEEGGDEVFDEIEQNVDDYFNEKGDKAHGDRGIGIDSAQTWEEAEGKRKIIESHTLLICTSLLALLLCIGMSVFLWRKCKRASGRTARMQYNHVRQSEDTEVLLAENGTSLFDDSSDDESSQRNIPDVITTFPTRTARNEPLSIRADSPPPASRVSPPAPYSEPPTAAPVKPYHDDSDEEMLY